MSLDDNNNVISVSDEEEGVYFRLFWMARRTSEEEIRITFDEVNRFFLSHAKISPAHIKTIWKLVSNGQTSINFTTFCVCLRLLYCYQQENILDIERALSVPAPAIPSFSNLSDKVLDFMSNIQVIDDAVQQILFQNENLLSDNKQLLSQLKGMEKRNYQLDLSLSRQRDIQKELLKKLSLNNSIEEKLRKLEMAYQLATEENKHWKSEYQKVVNRYTENKPERLHLTDRQDSDPYPKSPKKSLSRNRRGRSVEKSLPRRPTIKARSPSTTDVKSHRFLSRINDAFGKHRREEWILPRRAPSEIIFSKQPTHSSSSSPYMYISTHRPSSLRTRAQSLQYNNSSISKNSSQTARTSHMLLKSVKSPLSTSLEPNFKRSDGRRYLFKSPVIRNESMPVLDLNDPHSPRTLREPGDSVESPEDSGSIFLSSHTREINFDDEDDNNNTLSPNNFFIIMNRFFSGYQESNYTINCIYPNYEGPLERMIYKFNCLLLPIISEDNYHWSLIVILNISDNISSIHLDASENIKNSKLVEDIKLKSGIPGKLTHWSYSGLKYDTGDHTLIVIQTLFKIKCTNFDIIRNSVRESINLGSLKEMNREINAILELYNSSNQVEITQKVYKKCPYSKQLILRPLVGDNCKHLQPLDGDFVEEIMDQLKKPKSDWLCPICGLAINELQESPLTPHWNSLIENDDYIGIFVTKKEDEFDISFF